MFDQHVHGQRQKLREERVRAVQDGISKASCGPGYNPLGFTMLPRELRAAAEAAVDALPDHLK